MPEKKLRSKCHDLCITLALAVNLVSLYLLIEDINKIIKVTFYITIIIIES